MKPKHLKAKLEAAEAIPDIMAFLDSWDFGECGVEVNITPLGATLDYKAVFAIWMRHLAKSFTERDKAGKVYKSEDMHDLICNRFLGWTRERLVGKTVIKSSLRTITYPKQLDRGAFFNLMRQVDEWAASVGVVMPQKESQYEEDKARAAA